MSTQEHEMTSRRIPSSPAAPPLENDDLLSEILLRLPPEPSSLPRASLVCKRWRGLACDRGFLRRFRLHHRRNPPLLGLFEVNHEEILFLPTMEPPNRVPPNRFSLRFHDGFTFFGCRHGLVLIFDASIFRLLVWDPVTGDKHILSSAGFDRLNHGAVLRTPGDAQHFQVVMVGTEKERAIARVYSSETGIWGSLISAPLSSRPCIPGLPAVLVGDSLYWLLSDSTLLEFDLGRQKVAVLPVPVDMYAHGAYHFSVMRADGGGLGCLYLSKFSAQLWKRKIDCDGVASWMLGRTIDLDKLLPLSSVRKTADLMILGFTEDNNVVLHLTVPGVFMVQLDSLQFKKILVADTLFPCPHLFESVYAAGI